MIANAYNLPRRWFEMKHHPTVAEAYACQARFQFYRATRRGYKSEICKRKGVMKLPLPGKFGPRRIAYTSYTSKKAEDVFWEDFFSIIPKEWWKGYSKSKKEIYTIFGSVIKVGGPSDIEGVLWDDIYVTESADVPPSVISIVIMPTLSDTGGSLTREGVPKRKGKGARDYNRAFDYAQKNRKFLGTDVEARAFSWTSKGILDEKELAIQRALLSAKDYREQFEASIESAAGCVYHAWGADNIATTPEQLEICTYDPIRPIVVGMDFNVSPMCWVLGHIINGTFCIFDELHEFDTHVQACLDKLVDVYGGHTGGWIIYGDATSQSRHSSTPVTCYALIQNESRLINKRIYFPSKNPGVHNRISSLNRKMRDANGKTSLLVSPKCIKLIEDIEFLTYDEKGAVDDLNRTVGHFCDAIGYPVHAIWPVRVENQGTARVGIH